MLAAASTFMNAGVTFLRGAKYEKQHVEINFKRRSTWLMLMRTFPRNALSRPEEVCYICSL